jgi:hypothetical protein
VLGGFLVLAGLLGWISIGELLLEGRGRLVRAPVAVIGQRVAVPRAGHMAAISLSTRSSSLRNGSLHSTVRWA